MYTHVLRNRACAVVTSGDWILLLKHQSPSREMPIWLPPGGGIEFGESMEMAVMREVKEETGLYVKPVRLLWVHEFIEPPFHAIEYYFECDVTGGSLKLGEDPEHGADSQILKDLKFIPFHEIEHLPVYPKFLKEACLNGELFPPDIRCVRSIADEVNDL